MLHHDRVLDVKFLMASIFRNEPTGAPFNILWVYIHRLRKKLDSPPLEPLIQTIRSRGYMLRSPGEALAIS